MNSAAKLAPGIGSMINLPRALLERIPDFYLNQLPGTCGTSFFNVTTPALVNIKDASAVSTSVTKENTYFTIRIPKAFAR